ncbi:MAG: NAD(P)-dependent oxidoreductase [Candidatus Nitrosocosmicus sp.]|uniref:NAD(P)-dependent oxidoreductase n=1 Tax=Candidatus Nitrosocosmicus agrestis TaxID=2563600 RepID=UPI00122E6EAC|nr:NAD(P)-dependent oxidoreductase [Candidatus Nitrosocosmicus sp. SS]KAA2283408.1 hydroxyacid dehydrogenase [Candidatus Nitrosocosmicus sp. SS]KAF0868945.1 hydroxyacid dehydrogenase [Candidatus Nitrosocosmicus sp. SS]
MKIAALVQNVEFKQRIEEKMRKTNIFIDFIKNDEPLIPQIMDAEIIINSFNKIDRNLIDSCPKLKLVQQSGIGVDGIDIDYCTEKDIYVANVPLANAISVAEHTFLLMLYLCKNIKLDPLQSVSSTGRFVRREPDKIGFELQGKNLLIIGLGVTGIEVAKRAKAFGMKVTAITKHPFTKTVGGDKKYFVDYLYGIDKLVDVLPKADIVSIHTPLNQETENMIGKKELDLMKKSAYLVNVARAPIVSREALLGSLVNKNIAGAAFDVFWEEPADTDDPLLKLENFVLTPHLAGWTYEAIDSITDIMFMNFERILRGQIPMTMVNKG